MQVAHGIARTVRTHTEEIGRIAGSRGARYAARLASSIRRRRDRQHPGDLWHDDETRRGGAQRSALRQPERKQLDRTKRVQVMLPAGDETRPHHAACVAPCRQMHDRRSRASKRTIPG
jgi:hypothetical protein